MPSEHSKKKALEKKEKAAAARRQSKQASAAVARAEPCKPPNANVQCQLSFPASLTARQRAALHESAERLGLQHHSTGEGTSRRLHLGPDDAPHKVSLGEEAPESAAVLSDADIAQLVEEHLNISSAEFLAAVSKQQQQPPAGKSCLLERTAAAAGGGSKSGRKPEKAAVTQQVASYASAESFVELMRRLLDMEREAEVTAAQESTSLCSTATAQARGRTLLNLRVSDAEGGLLGRTLLTLVPNRGYGTTPAPQLPAHKFSPHDVVALKASAAGLGGAPLCTGLVYRVRDTSIVVAVDEPPEEGLEQPLRMEKLANEVTYKRLQDTLAVLVKPSGATNEEKLPGLVLIDVMFGSRQPQFAATAPQWKPFNTRLDSSQVAAVNLALKAQDVALVHGPPGTGKTTAVLEVILQEVARGSRVLATAASNIAVDNLVERLALAAPKLKLVRLGHPARLLPQVIDKSLEAQVLKTDNSSLARDCRRDMQQLNRQLVKLESWKRAERRQIRAELRQLAKEERQRQQKAVQDVVDAAQVMCCTLSGALHHQLDRQVFDVVVIDEAAQALEPACWSAMLKGRRVVLAGDHLQLPPTVMSDAASKQGLSCTLFERLQHCLADRASSMLTVQYRMHHDIMEWSSQELYEGLLTAHESVAGHTLADLPSCTHSTAAAALPPLLLIDTAGCGFDEQQENDGDSRCNQGEAEATMAHVQRLLAAGIDPTSIGIITPYSAQVALLKDLRPERLVTSLEISTVDGFQGREKEAVIISMVRSNTCGQVGFLADVRRMNVAVTRARRHVALICDTETVSQDVFIGRLIDYVQQHGEYESAAELLDR